MKDLIRAVLLFIAIYSGAYVVYLHNYFSIPMGLLCGAACSAFVLIKEELNVFTVNPKKGNAMLDKIHEKQQHDDAEKFYCEFRYCDVTYRKTCKNCIIAGADEDGNFYCPYYKK